MEMTGKDVARLEAAAGVIPAGTRIHITFLDNENLPLRVNAAAAVRRLGFTPVPHISARRLRSQAELEEFLSALRAVDATETVFMLGFASRLGISTSRTIARKYGFSMANLLGKAGPEAFLRGLEDGLDPARHGVVLLHFYTFGGFKGTAEWIARFRQELLRDPDNRKRFRRFPLCRLGRGVS